MNGPIHTPYARIQHLAPHEVEIRFTAGVTLDKAAIAEVIRARVDLCAGRPTGLLLLVPSDTDLDMSVLNTDNLKVNNATDRILGFAVVAGSAISEALLRLYKAYFPTPFEAEVFTDELEARAWLHRRVAEGLSAS